MDETIYSLIDECGSAEMPVNETAELAGLEVGEFLADKEAVRRYRHGRLTTKLKIRKTVILMAMNGDATMTRIYRDICKDTVDLTEYLQEGQQDAFPSLDIGEEQ